MSNENRISAPPLAASASDVEAIEPCPTCGGKGTVPSGVNPVVTVDCPECRPVVQVSEGSEAAGWQPIETAPKDGTTILVVVDFGKGQLVRPAEWVDHLDEWVDIDDEDFLPATHWMPLPKPPAALSEQSEGGKNDE